MKHIIRITAAVIAYYGLLHFSPALALLTMLTVIFIPLARLSYEIAVTEDRRAANGYRQQYQMPENMPEMQWPVYMVRQETQRTRILEA